MKFLINLALILTSLMPLNGFAENEQKKSAPAQTPEVQVTTTKEIMHTALDAVVKLIPLYTSEENFVNAKNEADIKKYLLQLKKAFVTGSHLQKLKRPSLAPSISIIQEHLDETLKLFETNRKSFARARLGYTTSICITCHSQLPKDQTTSFSEGLKKLTPATFKTEFEYAEYLFLVSDYRTALKYYEKNVKELTQNNEVQKNHDNGFDKSLSESLRKILTVHLKIDRSPASAQRYFNSIVGNKHLPPLMKDMVKTWIKELGKWQKIHLVKGVWKQKDVKTFINEYLVPMEINESELINSQVTFLISSGVLSNYLTTHPSSDIAPEILYWLGIAAHELNNNLFYDLSENYLKNCIKNYPTNPIAPRCFKKLEEQLVFGYSGSSGTHIPSDIREELNSLKALIHK